MTHIPFGTKFGEWWILISKLDGCREAYFESQLRSLRTEMCLVSSLSQGWADGLWQITPKQPKPCVFMILYEWYEWFPTSCLCFSSMHFHELSWTFTWFFFKSENPHFQLIESFQPQNPFRVHDCIFPQVSNQVFPPNVRWFFPGILSSKSWSLPPVVRKAPASKAFASGVGNRWNLGLGSCWIPFWV